MEWLTANQGPIVAVGTIVLAAATLVYVVLTRKLAKAAHASAEAANRLTNLELLPVVYSRSGSTTRSKTVSIYVNNYGRSAALAVDAWVESPNLGRFGEKRIAPFLAPGGEASQLVDLSTVEIKELQTVTEGPGVAFCTSYLDAIGNRYETRDFGPLRIERVLEDGTRERIVLRID